MRYIGGKQRFSKDIVSFLECERKHGQTYVEPFVGGASIICKMSGTRYGSDISEYLICLYKALQCGWIPTDTITEEQYKYIKEHKDEDKALTGMIGFGCSFGGKFFAGYARDSKEGNYGRRLRNALSREDFSGITFKCIDYRRIHPTNCLIYCDAPYKGTTQSGYDMKGRFDYETYYNILRKWSKNNTVFISEYNMPDDFICVWEKETKTQIRTNSNNNKRTERIFVHESYFS